MVENHPEGRVWKILIIGVGSIGKKHIHAIKSLIVGAEIIALRSSAEAEKLNGIKNVSSLDEINFVPDFVLISNPTNHHYNTILNCLKFSAPLFIEKPVLGSLDRASCLSNMIDQKQLITYVGCNLRFLDSIRFVKEYLAQANPRINEVNVYCGSFLPRWRPNQDFRQSYSSTPDYGGGVHLDLIHELDYIRWIFGNPSNVNKVLRSKSSLGIASVDYANYVLEYHNFAVSAVLNYYRTSPRRTLEIVMDDDVIEVDLITNTVSSYRHGLLMKSEQTMNDTYIAQMNYFIDCVAGCRNTFNTFSDGVGVLSICL